MCYAPLLYSVCHATTCWWAKPVISFTNTNLPDVPTTYHTITVVFNKVNIDCSWLFSYFNNTLTMFLGPHNPMTTWTSVLPNNHGLWQPFCTCCTVVIVLVCAFIELPFWEISTVVISTDDCYWLPPPTVICFSFTCFITASTSLNPFFPQ